MIEVTLSVLLVGMCATVVAIALIYSRDMKQLANGLQELVRDEQKMSLARENDIWVRSQKEIELQRRFLEDLHDRLLRAPAPRSSAKAAVETQAVRGSLPKKEERMRSPRRDMDLATVGT